MKYVLLYTSADNVATKAPAHFPAHQRWYQSFHERGDLLLIGTFGDPQNEGAMGVFRSREAAQDFVDGDPFIANGVIKSYEIRAWNEALTDS